MEMLLGVETRAAPAQLSTLQKSCFLLSFLPALWFLAVQRCSFYRDLQARERWGYLPEMWECGLKSPQAEEASNPSLNGGPSAVARNAVDHRLSCIIDSSPVSVAKSIRMPLHPLPAAVPPQGSAPASAPAPSPSLCGGPWRPVLLLPMGFSHCFAGRSLQWAWSGAGKAKGTHSEAAAPLYFWVKKMVPLVLITKEEGSAGSRDALGQKGFSCWV